MSSIQTLFRYTVSNFFVFAGNLLQYPFSRPARHRLSQSYDALIYPFSGDRSVELSEILQHDDLQITVAPLKARQHNTTEFELISVAGIIKDNKCNTVFEIGTFDGRTTRAIAMNLSGGEGKVYTLNLPPESDTVSLQTGHIDVELATKVVSGERFLNTPQEKLIQQVWGDSAKFDFTPYAGKMDAVFIDGAHSEEYAASDTKNALQLIKPEGGVILWHDAHLFGVKHFFKKWLKQHNYPVYFIRRTTLAVMGMKNGQPYDILKK
ncbi:class I SAM-dependent methyltransferase [Flavitalea sp. BT771]|uniref:class I SAM-dependent methyltransferase n=1 Tax=Flavitalea sp. BT771 TaxID=3063329 RepID=UPI0026E25E89|nr:class I SAM-dependent methyltransferase [Flavitalea sp. BT771]MDO6434154.1 class I SAM-dependent methyltransferase [Flavitalea sp. BT771]MDV6223054.1 class I SAM-dependent methyltransferase [Flavitalea sp. BT771]